jgi:16S rRNA (cytosine967-C5)-methyltransferase
VYFPLNNPISIKLHKPLLNAIVDALNQVFKEKRYTDKVLERLFKQNKQLGSRDRKFIAETVYDVVRHYRLLSEISNSSNNFWFMVSVYFVLKGYELPDWPEFKHIEASYVRKTHDRLVKNFVVYHSYPDELNALAEKELGVTAWQTQAAAMNEPAEVVLRVNTLKINKDKLIQRLKEEGVETAEIKGYPDALILKKRVNVFPLKSFQEGLFEIQDAGSQAISEFTQVKAGQTIIDACAGAGGKSLHLAAIMLNKGRITSMDVADWKLEELKRRAKRASVSIIKTKVIEPEKTVKELHQTAEVLLLDVPCSGSGVFKRNPDAKWKFNLATFEKTKALQQDILQNYATMLKPGGTLVYSTCSIFPSENENQVKLFLEKNSNFEKADEKSILPHEGFDGFYMCKLIKK